MASSINFSTSNAFSDASILSNLGLVTGFLGANTLQQSSSGIIYVSNVSIFLAISIISVLSIAISGLKTGKLTDAFVQVKPCIV